MNAAFLQTLESKPQSFRLLSLKLYSCLKPNSTSMQDFCNLSFYKFILHLEPVITCSLRIVKTFHVYGGKDRIGMALINPGPDFYDKNNSFPNQLYSEMWRRLFSSFSNFVS